MPLYRKPSKPAYAHPHPDSLRMKSWKTLPGMDIAPDDPVWGARCKQFWELQARLYGWRLSDFTMAYDNEHGFVSTYCVLLEIMPGERTAEHHRVPVESAGIAPLRIN
jgi:hypothetical protein